MRRTEGTNDPIVIIDRYTMKEVARFATIKQAVTELELNEGSIRHAVSLGTPIYQCYWVYLSAMPNFKPAYTRHIRVHGVKTSPKLQALIDKL